MKQTHYQILGIAKTASEKEVRTAHRRLVLLFHPDRNKSADATDRFIRIQEAYECLSNPERRDAYDRLLLRESAPPRPQPRPSAKRPGPKAPPTPAPSATPVRPPIEDALRLTRLLSKGRYLDAERLARQMIDRDPRQAMAYAALGDICRFRGDLKEAAKHYAYAAQMSPHTPIYQRKHEEVLRAVSTRYYDPVRGARPTSTAPLAVSSGVVGAAGLYVILSQEQPVLPSIEWVSTWTLGLVAMLLLCGVALGASLTLGGFVDEYRATTGSALAKVQPTVLLGLVAAINFWAAAALYVSVGASQNAFSASTSRVVGAVAGLTLLLAACAELSGRISGGQALLWGGNLAYMGALVGWIVADAFRE